MGRKPTRTGAIPRLRARRQKSGKVHYYYDHGGTPRKETALGSDYGLAVKRWAELEGERSAPEVRQAITFRYVAGQYRIHVVPTKAPRTQRDNLGEIEKLFLFFDDPPNCPLDEISPQDVHEFLAWRGKSAKTRANREKALLSHIWNWARSRGYTSLANPCAGIKGHKLRGRRDIYVEDEDFAAVYDKAPPALRDAMDLAYLTAQRPSDVLRMDESHVRDDSLEVRQSKTAAKLRIEVSGHLKVLLTRIRRRKQSLPIYSTRLIVAESGRPLTLRQLEEAFTTARSAAQVDAKAFQFRDLRAVAGTDKAEGSLDVRQAQEQLGHTSMAMTEHYLRARRGKKVTPTR